MLRNNAHNDMNMMSRNSENHIGNRRSRNRHTCTIGHCNCCSSIEYERLIIAFNGHGENNLTHIEGNLPHIDSPHATTASSSSGNEQQREVYNHQHFASSQLQINIGLLNQPSTSAIGDRSLHNESLEENCCYCNDCSGCSHQQICDAHVNGYGVVTHSEITTPVTGESHAAATAPSTTYSDRQDVDYFVRPHRESLDHYYRANLQRFAIYENLCQHCGFGIGCDCLNFDKHPFHSGADSGAGAYSEFTAETRSHSECIENIYENICGTCSCIYSGDKCEVCDRRSRPIVKKSPSASKQLNKLTELLGNLRQRLRERAPKAETSRLSPSSQRPQIVHNIGDVFKTNQTFDLNEIVRLKRATSCASTAGVARTAAAIAEKHVYGKLRSSDEHLIATKFTASNDRTHASSRINSSASETNFLENLWSVFLPVPPRTHSLHHTHSLPKHAFAASSAIHSPIYENLPASTRGVTIREAVIAGTASYLSAATASPIDKHIHSLWNWMTSLRRQTYDYGDDAKYAACIVKCIPSPFASCCESATASTGQMSGSAQSVDMSSSGAEDTACATAARNRNNNSERSNDMEVWTRVDEYRANHIENRSKRNAIYVKRSNTNDPEPIYIRVKDDAAQLNSAISLIGEDTTTDANANAICILSGSESGLASPIGEYASAMNASNSALVNENAHLSSSNNVQIGMSIENAKAIARCCPENTISVMVSQNEGKLGGRRHQRKHIITQLALSGGLNRSTIMFYDKHLHAFLTALINVPYENYQHLPQQQQQQVNSNLNDMITIYNDNKTRDIKPLACKRKQQTTIIDRIEKENINDFIQHPHDIIKALKTSTTVLLRPPSPSTTASITRQIDDFEKTHSINNNNNSSYNMMVGNGKIVIEDSQLLNDHAVVDAKKILNDFELHVRHKDSGHYIVGGNYSSAANNAVAHNMSGDCYKEEHEIKIRNSDAKNVEPTMPMQMLTVGILDEDDIYQSIWKFQTIGSARESDVSFVSEYYTASEFCEEIVDVAEWEVAEEFAFATERNSQLIDLNDTISCEDNQSVIHENEQYRTVCILYHQYQPKFNKIIYDYNGNNVFAAKGDDGAAEVATDFDSSGQLENAIPESMALNDDGNIMSEGFDGEQSTNIGEIPMDSIHSWKRMIRSIAYMEDEEEMMLPESFLLDSLVRINHERNSLKINKFNENSPMVSSNESLSDVPMCKFSERRLNEASHKQILNTTPPPETKIKRELGFLNKLQYRRFDVSKNNKKEASVQGLLYKNLDGKVVSENVIVSDVKKSNSSNLIFGVDLDEVEKDDKLVNIPKFVVECIKIIELEENIQTNGIYRASGKKESIDKLKKKMNESKLRKGTKYVTLKDEDVHTVTGALKQFFRELKTDLIPIEIVKRLPDELERPENLVKIRDEMAKISFLPRESLKYLLKHLICVDKNRQYNLMNASNLSIVWGACIFISSVTAIDTIETSDLMKKNTLFKILIQRFHDIFSETD